MRAPRHLGQYGPPPVEPRRPDDEGERDPRADLRFRLVVFGGAVTLLAVVAALLRRAVVREIGSTFAYGLDDPYIHLALAENLLHHGTWGLVPGVYESASSSPLWTLMLTGAVAALPVSSVWIPSV